MAALFGGEGRSHAVSNEAYRDHVMGACSPFRIGPPLSELRRYLFGFIAFQDDIHQAVGDLVVDLRFLPVRAERDHIGILRAGRPAVRRRYGRRGSLVLPAVGLEDVVDLVRGYGHRSAPCFVIREIGPPGQNFRGMCRPTAPDPAAWTARPILMVD